jgi:transposase
VGVFTFEKALFRYPSIVGVLCDDSAYKKHFKNIFEEFHNLKVDISERLDSTFKVMPKRWRVESTFAWLCNSRRLSKDYEIRFIYSETMVIISHLHTILRRF